MNIEDLLNDIRKTTFMSNETAQELLQDTIEEIGEYAAALTVESGRKNKPLVEDSKTEAIDVCLCALALFFVSGGDVQELVKISNKKLSKWKTKLIFSISN